MKSIFRGRKTLMFLLFAFMLNGMGKVNAQDITVSGQKGKIISAGIWVPGKVQDLTNLTMSGPFVKLGDGSILAVGRTKSFISQDGGKTWTGYEIFSHPDRFSIRPEHALLKTSNGIIILAFLNDKERAHWNWRTDIHDSPGATIPNYTIRSLDGGKTWQDLQKVHDDWTGAVRDMIETSDGSIIFTSMIMRHHPGHHTIVTYTSKNDGKTWYQSNIIDLGGIGNHGGVSEATIAQLKNGRVWMLFRTNWGALWEAFSDDDGLTWRDVKASPINASSAPGMLLRLKSGRLVLVWNRWYPEGKNSYPLSGGDRQVTQVPVSNFRGELSIAFSNDEGKSWSRPVVIARAIKKGAQIAYPHILEYNPGELWITTMFGGLKIKLFEKDFIQ